MNNIDWSVRYQEVIALGGSRHGERLKIDTRQLRQSISRVVALPKRQNIKWATSENLIHVDYKIEVEYYQLVYTFSAPNAKPYLVIEGGDEHQLLIQYLQEQIKSESAYDMKHLGRDLSVLVPGLEQELPIEVLHCPVCGSTNVGSKVKNRIVHLNDVHKWSFEQIADYLETLPIDLRVREDVVIKRPDS